VSLPFVASFSRLNDRLNAFFERIQDRQLFGKAQGGTLPAPRSFLSKDARNIRISRSRILHSLKLGCLQWIRNGRLRAKNPPIAHQIVSLQDTSEQNQIHRSLLQKSLNASQILEPAKLDRYCYDVLRPQTSRRQRRIAGYIDLKIDCAVQSFFVKCRRRRQDEPANRLS
jgi:hypothetical protein